ncbi:TRAP transporter small permease [Bacillus sp. 1780r2a1]|nr:TRAP transporter small permease [Bacillus sp. 1780r2a1]
MKKIVDRITEFLTCSLIVLMVLAAIWQVFSRFILNTPSAFTEEFLRYSLIWLTMVGGAYAFGKKEHLAIVFIVRKFSKSIQKVIAVATDVLVVLFVLSIFMYGGSLAMNNAVGQISSALQMPIQYLYLSLVVSGCLFLFYAIFHLQNTLGFGVKEKNKSNNSEVNY